MKPLLKFLALAAILTAAACSPSPPEPAKHRMGADFSPNVYWLPNVTAVAGNNATITVFDSTLGYPNVQRVMVSGYYDQAVTVLYRIKNSGSSTWRTANGSGSGDAVTASTVFVTDYFMLGPSNQIQVVTGGTGPTTSETSVGLVYERTLGM